MPALLETRVISFIITLRGLARHETWVHLADAGATPQGEGAEIPEAERRQGIGPGKPDLEIVLGR
jgi:hypothetical protein